MSSPVTISALIEAAVLQIPNLLFLRASAAEANIQLDDIDLAVDSVAIYNNRPDTTAAMGDLSGQVETTWPVEIQILALADFDDNTDDYDTLVDPLYVIATELFDRITEDQGSDLTFADSYGISMGATAKLYDKTLSGVMLSFDIYYSRGIKCYP